MAEKNRDEHNGIDQAESHNLGIQNHGRIGNKIGILSNDFRIFISDTPGKSDNKGGDLRVTPNSRMFSQTLFSAKKEESLLVSDIMDEKK